MHLLSDQVLHNIQLMNFRTYLEFDKNYKRFSAELINLFITIYIISQIFLYCLANNLSWILTISLVGFLTIYFYTQFICLISFVSNAIMSTSSLIILIKTFSDRFFINRSLFILIYLVFLYPLFYLLLRRLTINLSHTIGLKLESIRKRIDHQCLPSFLQYHSSNKLYRLIINLVKFFVLLFLVLFL